jgi:hypothetical protein
MSEDYIPYTTVSGIVVNTTEKAVLIRILGIAPRLSTVLKEMPEEWVPRSQIRECHPPCDALEKDDKVDMEIADWILRERGLL